MRFLLKTWDNRKERRIGLRHQYNGWNRRVRWYEGDTIRLSFEDDDGKQDIAYTDRAKAQQAWDAFKKGELTVKQLLG